MVQDFSHPKLVLFGGFVYPSFCAASFAKYVRIMSAPARLMPVSDSSITFSSSIQPSAAADLIMRLTLNACAVYAYIAMMVIAPVNGLLKFGQLAFGMKIFLYILQLAIYGFCGAYLTFKRFSIWTKAKGKADIEREVRNSNR